ncbi:MAG: SIS domain-containing protein [Planctomycetes bacterium]|nr:SIS domain-containing protein [Planctomycetota bacterium]
MSYVAQYLDDVTKIAATLDRADIEKMIDVLLEVRRDEGRLFIIGVGGSAGNASHAVNDFRKIVGIESYAPSDNVSELTARTNDEGFNTIYSEWLRTSHVRKGDAVLVFSVGGGNRDAGISVNLVEAIDAARTAGARILGIVGRDGGYTKKTGDAVVVVPTPNPDRVTPHAESFQAVIWHLLVSDPRLMQAENKWESTKK